MPSRSPSTRSQVARIAAHESWANTPDRAARTAPARAALSAKFEHEVDPAGQLTPAERAQRAESARKAYYARLALKSAQVRRERSGQPVRRGDRGGVPNGAAR